MRYVSAVGVIHLRWLACFPDKTSGVPRLPHNQYEEPMITEEAETNSSKQKFKRLHQDTCGVARMEYDNYDDVLRACERKLAEWERAGIIRPWQAPRNNDWLFARR